MVHSGMVDGWMAEWRVVGFRVGACTTATTRLRLSFGYPRSLQGANPTFLHQLRITRKAPSIIRACAGARRDVPRPLSLLYPTGGPHPQTLRAARERGRPIARDKPETVSRARKPALNAPSKPNRVDR